MGGLTQRMTMDVYRITEEGKDEYQWFPHSAAQNPNLSYDAIGLLCRLLADGEKFETVRELADDKGRDDANLAEESARELESEGYMRFGERTEVWAVPFGWETVASLTGDERALLEVVAASPAPLSSAEVRDAVLPAPAGGDGRSREYRLWAERADALADALIGLWNTGLIWEAVPPNGEHGSLCEITAIGRLALAAAKAAEGRNDG
jgi:hypothetical protein